MTSGIPVFSNLDGTKQEEQFFFKIIFSTWKDVNLIA